MNLFRKLSFFTLVIILLFSEMTNAQQQSTDLLKQFIYQTADRKIPFDNIIDTFLCLDKMNDTSMQSANQIAMVKMQLESLREELSHKDLSKFKFVPYRKLSKSEQNILVNEDSLNDIYVVTYDGKRFLNILFKQDKIRSFATMNKGGKHVLMVICTPQPI